MQSGRDGIERNHLYDLGRAHLPPLGLLKNNYGNVKKGQIPEFDLRSGNFMHSVEVSGLGRMLRAEVGLGGTWRMMSTERCCLEVIAVEIRFGSARAMPALTGRDHGGGQTTGGQRVAGPLRPNLPFGNAPYKQSFR